MAPAFTPPVTGANKPAARRIVAAHRLPLRSAPDPDSPFGFAFSLDPEALPLQLSHGLPTPVTFIGTLPASAASAVPSVELDNYLREKFSCLLVHLDSDCHTGFYDNFCKRYLWPQLHYLLPVATPGEVCFDEAAYRCFVKANMRFADRVIEVLSPKNGDAVIVHDYHLWLLPTFLRHKYPSAGVGFFLHSPFPSADVFRNIQVRQDLILALLNADLVGFQTYDYAGHFLSSCSSLLGISSRSSRRGHVSIDSHGRTILVKVLPVGVDMGHLRGEMASPEAVARAKEIAEAYRGRKLIIGVDDVDRLKGVTKKLEAVENLLNTEREMRGQVVLVQINNPARSNGADVDGVRQEIDQTRQRVNERYGQTAYTPVVMIDGPLPMWEKVAYYAAADCCVVSAVRDGLNRIPYFYTVCREEGSAAAENGDAAAQRTSAVVVSEFIGCSPSLGGAIRVNPFSKVAVAEAMHAALTMPTEDKQSRHRQNYNYLSSHDVVTWARSFDASLQVACQDQRNRTIIGMGLGTSYRAVAYDAGFKKLMPEHALPAYRAAARRLIVLELEYDDGTAVPDADVIDLLNKLCSDPSNVVFLVSGRSKDLLAEWFSPCEKLGICAEHGYYIRWSRDDPWEVSKMVASDFAWKETAELLMKHYTETTEGSYIENAGSTVAWHFQNADLSLGCCQAKDLLNHLESYLAKEPVSVTRGWRRQVVEVKPQGVTKGVAVEGLISAMARRGEAPDFVLCFGDDECMFEALAGMVDVGDDDAKEALLPAGARVFTCTIQQVPSKAAFYLHQPLDILAVLRGVLATCSWRPAPQQPADLSVGAAPHPLGGMFEIVSLASGGLGMLDE